MSKSTWSMFEIDFQTGLKNIRFNSNGFSRNRSFGHQPVLTNVTYYFRFGVCCLFIVSSTSDTINQNCTYIQNPSFPSVYSSQTALTYTINKCSSDVCSVRLDFETMTIQGNFGTLGFLILPYHWVLVITKIMLLKPVQNWSHPYTFLPPLKVILSRQKIQTAVETDKFTKVHQRRAMFDFVCNWDGFYSESCLIFGLEKRC